MLDINAFLPVFFECFSPSVSVVTDFRIKDQLTRSEKRYLSHADSLKLLFSLGINLPHCI